MYDYIKCDECLYKHEVYDGAFECRSNPPILDHRGYACWPRLNNLETDGCYEGVKKLDKEVLNG